MLLGSPRVVLPVGSAYIDAGVIAFKGSFSRRVTTSVVSGAMYGGHARAWQMSVRHQLLALSITGADCVILAFLLTPS
jgi:hypothetical protein